MRQDSEHRSNVVGIIMTLIAHACALVIVSFTGLEYIYPPPPESTFLLDFEEEEEVAPMIRERKGRQPQAEEVDRTKPVELVQKSESPVVAKRQNLAPEGQPDEHGDVEVPAPKPKEPEVNKNALFPGMGKKDTTLTAPHASDKESAEFKAGQPDGNTKVGKTTDKPNAHVKGRNTIGNLPRPAYNVQESGTVVVSVWVDNFGNVTKALPGADGTTVTDKTLWQAARNAAMNTHFNQSADAPALQEGTITYIFKLQ